MPNYVKTNIAFEGSKRTIDYLRAFMTSDKSAFDFEKLLPCPKELRDVDAGYSETFAVKCAKAAENNELPTFYEESSWEKRTMAFEDWVKLGKKYLHNLKKYNAQTWYDWCIDNWGTKWNALEPVWLDDTHVTFETAWSYADPILRKLSRKYPSLKIYVDFADEDLGRNCGHAEYCAAEDIAMLDRYHDYKFACDVWGCDPDDILEEGEELGIRTGKISIP